MKMREFALMVAMATALTLSQPARAGLEVLEGHVSYKHLDMARVAGLIQNTGSEPVCAPQVQVQWLDAAGKPLGVRSVVTLAQSELGRAQADGVMAQRRYLPPGEAAVFTYRRDLRKINGTPAGHRITASARACARPQPRLEMAGLTHQTSKTGFHQVEGQVRNAGPGHCLKPLIVLGLFDAQDKLLESEVVRLPGLHEDRLAAGAGTPFSRRSLPNPMGLEVAKIRAWPDCGGVE
ncbi:hypothetical protein [Inhella proteolytica]|uniref:Uncharacterized protein n=1 Tax=Inhella proteolytica TaxID=2795029 RepID=A0A931JA88_9BURK|nr:hypothetical protein [Inhella proteolytica]MBH9579262.1 hypothetical protein [Inhella proteolytica]